MGTMEIVTDFILGGSKFTADGDCSHEIKRHLLLGRKVMTNLDSMLKKQRHYFANKGPSSQGYGFSSSHVWMWELDHKETWAPKNWCFWTMELEKTLESPLDCKEIQPVHPKGNESWIFIGRTDAEAEVPPDVKSRLIGKDRDAGKDWGQEEKGVTENEMVEWHHRINRHEFEKIQGNSEGQGNLACFSSWGCKEFDTTYWLNNNDQFIVKFIFNCICLFWKCPNCSRNILAWRILGTEEPGGLPSMGSHRVGHDWSNLAAAAAADWLIPNTFFSLHSLSEIQC